jgi:hypothetical protein
MPIGGAQQQLGIQPNAEYRTFEVEFALGHLKAVVPGEKQ